MHLRPTYFSLFNHNNKKVVRKRVQAQSFVRLYVFGWGMVDYKGPFIIPVVPISIVTS